MIPFMNHDDANRTLMGSNMQEQSTPCLIQEAPIVATGVEGLVGRDTGRVIYALEAGEVVEADANHIVVKHKDGKKKVLGIRLVKVSQKKGTLTIYPNQSNGVFNLSFEANRYHKVELIDLAGKILMTRAIGRQERTMSFNISNLAAGIYNVKLTGNEKVARKQIVKE
jgi:DNA-directed RNA polymerase beta subunit